MWRARPVICACVFECSKFSILSLSPPPSSLTLSLTRSLLYRRLLNDAKITNRNINFGPGSISHCAREPLRQCACESRPVPPRATPRHAAATDVFATHFMCRPRGTLLTHDAVCTDYDRLIFLLPFFFSCFLDRAVPSRAGSRKGLRLVGYEGLAIPSCPSRREGAERDR